MKISKKILIVLLAVLVYLKLWVDETSGRFSANKSKRETEPHAGGANGSDSSNGL